MRILIAPAPYKGFMSSQDAIHKMAEGVYKVLPSAELVTVPMSSGGVGFAESFAAAYDAQVEHLTSEDPFGKPVEAPYVETEKVVALEAAPLLRVGTQEFGRLFIASSRGLGLAILQLRARFPDKELLIGVGDCEVMDAGKGAAEVLGARFIDMEGREVAPGASGLLNLAHIRYDRTSRVSGVSVVCDYNASLDELFEVVKWRHPTSTKREALQVYLGNFERILRRVTRVNVHKLPGGATAYGMPALFHTLFGWGIVFGAYYVANAFEFDYKLLVSDLVLTGEGNLDTSSFKGKVVGEVLKRAERLNRKSLVFVGSMEEGLRLPRGSKIIPIDEMHEVPPASKEEAEERLLNATIHALQEYVSK